LHSHVFDERLLIGADDAERGLGPRGQVVSVGGIARIASILDGLEKDAEAFVYLDAGDLLEGTSMFPRFGGVPEVRLASYLGVAAVAAGNHDLAFGEAALGGLLREAASFPLLAANLPRLEANELVVPTTIVERDGLRLGVVGLGRLPDSPPLLDDAIGAVNRAVFMLRPRVDVIVALSHLGRDMDLALVPETTGLDLVIGGHSHDFLEPPALVDDCNETVRAHYECAPRSVPVVHTGAYGRYVGRVDIVVDAERAGANHDVAPPTDDTSVRRASPVLDYRFSTWPVNELTPPRPDVLTLLEPYRRALDAAGFGHAVAFVPAALARVGPDGGDSSLGNFVARSLRAATGTDIGVVASSGLRADLPEGEVTRDDWSRVLPFDDTVIRVSVTGAALLRAIRAFAKVTCARGGSSPLQIDGATVRVVCQDGPAVDVSLGAASVSAGATYVVGSVSFFRAQWESAGGTVLDGEDTLTDVVVDGLGGLPACAGSLLPCIASSAGALVDHRIYWN
jgi:5'-nucleotidase